MVLVFVFFFIHFYSNGYIRINLTAQAFKPQRALVTPPGEEILDEQIKP
jgi:hypothetical protein